MATSPSAFEGKLREVFVEAFGCAKDDFGPELTPDDVVGWNSIGHLRLVAALEEAFGVTFDYDEASEMDSVPAILSVLRKKLG